jgi:hypothetical protein
MVIGLVQQPILLNPYWVLVVEQVSQKALPFAGFIRNLFNN